MFTLCGTFSLLKLFTLLLARSLAGKAIAAVSDDRDMPASSDANFIDRCGSTLRTDILNKMVSSPEVKHEVDSAMLRIEQRMQVHELSLMGDFLC